MDFGHVLLWAAVIHSLNYVPLTGTQLTGLFSLVADTISLFTQLPQVHPHVWLEVSNLVKFILLLIALFALLPLLRFLPHGLSFMSRDKRWH